MEPTHSYYLNREDSRVYNKLSAAEHDLSHASRFARYILAKGWDVAPWSGEEMGETYLQQDAFSTAMITSYGRAFTNSEGYGRLSSDLLDVFDAEERALHDIFMKLRHEVYAHTDSESYRVVPVRIEGGVSDMKHLQYLQLDHDHLRMLISMCKKMNEALSTKRREIRSRY